MKGASAKPTGPSQAEPEDVSALVACAPRLAFPRCLQWSMNNGYLTMTYPGEMTPAEVDEVEQVLAIAVGVMRRAAKEVAADQSRLDRFGDPHAGIISDAIAIEAATAGETAKTGSTRSAKAGAVGIAQKDAKS